MTPTEAHYWDTVAAAWRETHRQILWCSHRDAVNIMLFARWLPRCHVDRLLKTDLFEEAVVDGLYPLLASRTQVVVGIDLSVFAAGAAQLRHTALRAAGADVRRLPFADGVFDVIISNSTLDHFESRDEIVASLRELHRVLRAGGQLLLTLDNLVNPVIALRNILPFRLLNRIGVVPYFVGATYGPHRLQYLLRQLGFEVIETNAVMHCQRMLAVAFARLLERHARPEIQRRFLRLLMAFERLSRWPTRFLTGHYIAVRAAKR